MRALRIALFALALTSVLGGSTAQGEDFGRSGFYVGANAAYAFDLFQTEIYNAAGFGTGPLPLDYSDSWGFNVRAGYRLLSFLAIEAQYEWMDGIDISLPNVAFLGTYEPDVLTANLKLILPTWRLQPYLLAGAGLASWSFVAAPNVPVGNVSGNGFAFRGGAGIDIYLTEHLALNAEGTAVLNTADFNVPNTAAATLQSNLYYFSLGGGLTYRF